MRKLAKNSTVIIDAHVHIHDCFQLSFFLDSALHNFREAASRQHKKAFKSVLLLSEAAGANWFRQLSELVGDANNFIGSWRFWGTSEACSLRARRSENEELIIVAGRQIVTSENLEVLALGTDQEFIDGQPIADVIKLVRSSGALVVLPWGFGKWTGKRGAIIRRLIAQFDKYEIFLGDNSGRLRNWPVPSQFKLATRKGIRILPGSDPLPFATESWRPGSYGVILDASIDENTPFNDVKQAIHHDCGMRPYGRRENHLRFIRNQMGMQLLKRRSKTVLKAASI